MVRACLTLETDGVHSGLTGVVERQCNGLDAGEVTGVEVTDTSDEVIDGLTTFWDSELLTGGFLQGENFEEDDDRASLVFDGGDFGRGGGFRELSVCKCSSF